MDPTVAGIGVVLLVFLLLLFLGRRPWRPRGGDEALGGSLRSDAIQAEIEARDIDEMIEARNERRRRAGRPDVGDELAEQLRRDLER